MPSSTVRPPFDRFLATAEEVVRARPGTPPEMIREIFLEVATTLDDGLVLDDLDESDTEAVVAGLCEDLVTEDPGSAVRARAQSALEAPGDLHDPAAVRAAYITAVQLMGV
jgi:hypothetical protein